ncbi:hypothetical protein FS749_006447, partial [Ceratobasidium sp. UAMH 11750]
AEPLKAVGYRYLHQIACTTPEQLNKETGVFIPILCEVHDYSVTVLEMVQMEQVQMPKGKEKEHGKD